MSQNIHLESNIEEEQIDEINITPLADVSLTLLIIMMILTPMIMQTMIIVNAGKVKAAPAVVAELLSGRPISIDIGTDMVFLNNEMIEKEEIFISKLKSLLAKNPDPAVLITVSPGVKHGRVVQVLDLSKMNGAKKLSIVPRKKI